MKVETPSFARLALIQKTTARKRVQAEEYKRGCHIYIGNLLRLRLLPVVCRLRVGHRIVDRGEQFHRQFFSPSLECQIQFLHQMSYRPLSLIHELGVLLEAKKAWSGFDHGSP